MGGDSTSRELTEIFFVHQMRLFESTIEEPPSDDETDLLQVVLGACKFLDLLLALQTDGFQL